MTNILGEWYGNHWCAIQDPRFKKRVVSLAQNAAVGQAIPVYRPGKHSYGDWVIRAIQGLKEHLGLGYRNLTDVLREMLRARRMLGLTANTLLYHLGVCEKATNSGETLAIDVRIFRRVIRPRRASGRRDNRGRSPPSEPTQRGAHGSDVRGVENVVVGRLQD